MIVVSGLVLEVEHKKGSSADDDGVMQPYDYHKVTVLDTPRNLVVRLSEDVPVPKVGEKFTAACRIGVYRGNLTVRALEAIDLEVDSIPAALVALFAGATRGA